jgi:hypothetical protein
MAGGASLERQEQEFLAMRTFFLTLASRQLAAGHPQ